jgi:Uma2 family endonuclease
VAVVDADAGGDPRYTDRFYLAAEVVSDSDRNTVAAKSEIYKRHPHCSYVLVVQQDRYEVNVAIRSGEDWNDTVLTDPGERLVLLDMGLRCAAADLYKGTAVRRSASR